MSILLIDSQGAGSMGRALVEWIPAGLRRVAGILEDHKVDYGLLFIEDILKDPGVLEGFDLVMATGMSSDFPLLKKVGKLINSRGRSLVVGGPVAFEPIRVLREAGADLVFIGEAEESLSDALQAGLKDSVLPEKKDLVGIKGIAYQDGLDNVLVNRQERYMSKEALDSYRSSVKLIEDYPFHEDIMVVMEILRGCSNFHKPKLYHGKKCMDSCSACESQELRDRLSCHLGTPGGCGFCSVGGLYGPPRSREQGSIIKELKGLIEHGATKITILDPDPLDYKRDELVAPEPLTDPAWPPPNYDELERLGEMIWAIPEVGSGEVVVTVRDVKATLVNDRSVELLKGFFPRSLFGIGCETGSTMHSRMLGRPYDPEHVIEAARIFSRHGVKPKINMIAGLPWQTRETTDETLMLMDRLEPYISHFDFTRFESLPMSGLDDHPSDRGPLKDENSRRLLERSRGLQRKVLERFVGERLKIVIGRFSPPHKRGGGDERAPKRGFRSLAGLVGYPIFDQRQLSLYATVIRITKDEPGLKNGDPAFAEITGVSQLGFRMVLEGRIVA